MIYIRVELWPFGDERRRKVIGEMAIYNDGTGTPERGNYKAWWGGRKDNTKQINEFRLGDVPAKSEVNDYPRKSYNVFELLRRCLNAEKQKVLP